MLCIDDDQADVPKFDTSNDVPLKATMEVGKAHSSKLKSVTTGILWHHMAPQTRTHKIKSINNKSCKNWNTTTRQLL